MENQKRNVLLRAINYIKPVSVIMLPSCIAALRAVSGDLLYFSPEAKLWLLNGLSGAIVAFLILGGGEFYWDKMRDVLISLKKDDRIQ